MQLAANKKVTRETVMILEMSKGKVQVTTEAGEAGSEVCPDQGQNSRHPCTVSCETKTNKMFSGQEREILNSS